MLVTCPKCGRYHVADHDGAVCHRCAAEPDCQCTRCRIDRGMHAKPQRWTERHRASGGKEGR
jgi:hypothetical protein